MQEILDNIFKDIQKELTNEFRRKNFRRKGFFKTKWKETKRNPGIGSLMMRKGRLRNSIKSERQGSNIVFSSSVPYAEIHNEGGTINRVSSKGKSYTINIPQRQFIGMSPEVEEIITDIVHENLTDGLADYFDNFFNSDLNE